MNSIGTGIIKTERLTLRKFDFSDAGDMLELWTSKPEVQHMYSEPTYNTIDEVNGLLEKYIQNYDNSDYYRWAIVDNDSNRCIGQIAFYIVDTNNHFAEIEYCISTDYQNRGLMTEAVKSVIKFGFEEIGLHKIQISTKEINAPSKRVIEKSGFTYEGTLRDYFYYDGKYIDRLYYSMIFSEYKNLKGEIKCLTGIPINI